MCLLLLGHPVYLPILYNFQPLYCVVKHIFQLPFASFLAFVFFYIFIFLLTNRCLLHLTKINQVMLKSVIFSIVHDLILFWFRISINLSLIFIRIVSLIFIILFLTKPIIEILTLKELLVF